MQRSQPSVHVFLFLQILAVHSSEKENVHTAIRTAIVEKEKVVVIVVVVAVVAIAIVEKVIAHTRNCQVH